MKYIVIALAFFSIPLFGQEFSKEEQHVVDSVTQLLKDPNTPDTVYVRGHIQLSEYYYRFNMDSMLNQCTRATKIANSLLKGKINKKEKLYHRQSLAMAYNNIGFVHKRRGELKMAQDFYTRSLNIFKEIGPQAEYANILNNLAAMYEAAGQIQKSAEMYYQSLALFEKSEDTTGMAILYNNIGLLYKRNGENDNAMSNYRNALKLHTIVGDSIGIAMCYNNIGMEYSDVSAYDSALFYMNKAVKIHLSKHNYRGLGMLNNNLGVIKSKRGDYQGALAHYFISIENYEKIDAQRGLTDAMINVAKAYLKLENFPMAYKYGKLSYDKAVKMNIPSSIRSATSLMSKYYEKVGNYQLALELYKKHISIRDSLYTKNSRKNMLRQEAKYEYEKQKAIDDAEHEKQLAIEQEAKKKQQIITYATAGGLGLVGIFLIFVFNRLKVTRKQKDIIEQAHTQLGVKNKEILDSITYAKRIQSAILPPNKVVKEYLHESFILYKPKDIVAGDFYWLEHKDDRVLFAAADCTGHGVPGAMVSVVCNNGLNRSVREYGLTEPGEILNKTREIVVQEFEKSEEEVKDGMDIALCSLQFHTPNTKNQTPETAAMLQYAGAHNPLWIIRKGADDIEEIRADKQPIGQTENPEAYITHHIELQKGDTIYIFSDGYADQFGGANGKKFKSANFKKLLLSIQTLNMESQREKIAEAFESWKGDLEQLDDVCVIGVQV